MNPALAPRKAACIVCRSVAVVRDVTIRMYGPNLEPLPLKGAIDYLVEVGVGTDRALLGKRLRRHRDHIDKWMADGGVVSPASVEDGISRIEAPVQTAWVDANQVGINLGMAAMQRLAGRLDGMKDKDLVTVARMGQGAVATRASLELKGAIKREQARAAVVSGFDPE